MNKDKQQSQFDKLKQSHSEWEEFAAKSKIRMKKKLKKDKTQYYDFDYTRGQYYYNYPQHHINFAQPEVQRAFFKEILDKETQQLSPSIIAQHQGHSRIEEDLSPLELHTFLKQFKERLHQRIASLRIRKTLYIRSHSQEKEYLNLLEAQIRSYFYRYQKLHNTHFTFSKSLNERMQGVQSSLKIKQFDEMHFSQLDKGDIVLFLRMENVRQRMEYSLDSLLLKFKINLQLNKGRLKALCYQQRCAAIKQLEQAHGLQYMRRKEKIEEYFRENQPQFLDSDEHLQLIENYLTGLNLAHMYSRHRSSGGKTYLDGTKLVTELPYIPSNETELKKILLSICSHYFPITMIEELYEQKRQNLCFRLNYFASILLRTMGQNNNFLVEIKEKDLHQYRASMRRQLQTMFTSAVDRLFGLPEYEIVNLVDEGTYHIQEFLVPVPKEQQLIFIEYFRQNPLIDPLSKAVLSILDVFTDRTMVQLAEQQAKSIIQKSALKLRYLSLYYANLHSDEKSHLISLIQNKLLLGMFNQNVLTDKIDKILQEGETPLDINLLKTTYLLLLIRCIQLKKDLEHVLTAQISLMYKLKYRIKLLKHKNSQPFQMTEEFFVRFTESNTTPQPFKFLNRTENSNPSQYPDPQLHDTIKRVFVGEVPKIEVRRMRPENPLFEGKKILYREAIRQSSDLIEKMQQTCAFLIERRQNYLHEDGYTGLVDRFQLIKSLITAELGFQTHKLSYLQELGVLVESTITPQGIAQVARSMVDAKATQIYMSLNQFHCLQQYEAAASVFASKAKTLNRLRVYQANLEKQQQEKFRNKMMRHNHQNNVPEISSIYYSDELPMEMEGDIQEAAEEDSCSDMSEVHSQFMANSSSKFKSDFSAADSEYHVKTTFKQILGRNALNVVTTQTNRREELMGRKKKMLINDSVLGGLLTYAHCTDYLYIHKSLQVVSALSDFYSQNMPEDSGVEKQFWHLIEQWVVQEDAYPCLKEQKQLLEEDSLHRVLADINRAISRVTEKIKLAPSALDDYLFMSTPLLERLITGTSSNQVNEIRGLYTCLNIVQLVQLHYRYGLLGHQEQSFVKNALESTLKTYSTQYPKEGFCLSEHYLAQEEWLGPTFPILAGLEKNKNRSLQFVGKYSTYFRISMILNQSFVNYYHSSLQYLAELVNEYQLLKKEFQSMESTNCYFGSNPHILKIPNIDNKVFVRKKYDWLVSHQTRLLSAHIVRDMLSVPKSKIQQLTKFQKAQISKDKHLVENSKQFQDYITTLGVFGLQMEMASRGVNSKKNEKINLDLIQDLCQVLPFIHNFLCLEANESTLLRDTFSQYFQHLASFDKPKTNKEDNVNLNIKLVFDRLSFSAFAKPQSMTLTSQLRMLVRSAIDRKSAQFGDKEDLNLKVYYRQLGVEPYQTPFRLEEAFPDCFQNRGPFLKALRLRVWMEAKIVTFGASLDSRGLLQLRMVLANPENNFHIFWVDESSQLIRYADTVRMRYQNIDQQAIKDQYTYRFITYQNLKVKYKNLIDSLADIDFNNEGLEIINLFYIANKAMLRDLSSQIPSFLTHYCFLKTLKNSTSLFVQYAAETNPNRYLSYCQPLDLSTFKRYIWGGQALQTLRANLVLLQDKYGMMKQILNSSNTKMTEITTEIGAQLYHAQRVKQLLGHLGIVRTPEDKYQYRIFMKKFQEDLVLGHDKLTKLQKYISKFVEKVVKDKPELLSVKDEILQNIYQCRFNERLILNRLFELARQTLNQQVSLAAILHENFNQKELMRENKIIKNTINKVLVPKIIINPFLQSPLILDNYFFAASLKLSYIDSFLNRLKNRAIMVELAEGGFGFLLKVAELDQCVQVLCKGIITFTEKQFNDRFRTFVESHEELQQKYRKSEIQNEHLKQIVGLSRDERGKELQSLLYNKLDSYLITMHTKEKTYQSLFHTLKSLQTEINDKVNKQYQSRIKQLQQENDSLKSAFVAFKHRMTHNAQLTMEQSRDILFQTFKKDVEGILNKQILKKNQTPEQKTFQHHRQTATQTLLKRIQAQKVFYEMKIVALEGKIKSKTEEVNKLHHKLIELQNTLTSEQFKTGKVAEQVKHMHLKSIQIEQLKKQMAKREEEETINRFKLIKVNENLQGKVARLQDKKLIQSKIRELPRLLEEEKSVAVQTVEKERKERRSFKIRTEMSQPSHQGYGSGKFESEGIWKEKWEQSERKYQVLMSKIVQAYETYSINKHLGRLAEKVQKVVQECLANRIVLKQT